MILLMGLIHSWKLNYIHHIPIILHISSTSSCNYFISNSWDTSLQCIWLRNKNSFLTFEMLWLPIGNCSVFIIHGLKNRKNKNLQGSPQHFKMNSHFSYHQGIGTHLKNIIVPTCTRHDLFKLQIMIGVQMDFWIRSHDEN